MSQGGPSDQRHLPRVAHPPRRFDGAALVVGLALLGLAALLFWDASRLPAATGYSGMGPADTPRVIGVGLAVLGLWTLLEAFRSPAEPAPAQDIPPILWILGGLGLQLLLVQPLGFSVAGGVLFACTAAAFGRRKLWMTLPIGLAFALAVFGVFALLLELSLPAGPLERLLFGL